MTTFVTSRFTMMNIRLKQFLTAENITQSQFADTIKVVRASVSHVLSGRNKPGYEFITAIMTAYPNLSMEWLILGKGKMYRSAAPQETNEKQQLLFDYQEAIPLDEGSSQETFVKDTVQDSPSELQTNLIKTLSDTTQNIVKQRKAVKIIVFYDDGSYQEIAENISSL